MGRISSRYNYRISKTKKGKSEAKTKKATPPDKVVIRNNKKKIVDTKVNKSTSNDTKIQKRRKVNVSNSIAKSRKHSLKSKEK